MTHRIAIVFIIGSLASLAAVARSVQKPIPESNDRVVLITLDGTRGEEIFGGLDRDIARSTLQERQTLETHPVYRRFLADTPAARREKLMPFFWGTLMKAHGSIAGNPAAGSVVRLRNKHRFSYPGYAEILLGEAHDDEIASNDPVQNPYVTVLEELRARLGLTRDQVAVFGSWDVFRAIAEHTPGAILVNAGMEAFERPDPLVKSLSSLQFEVLPPWDGVRYDAFTFRLAMAHLEAARPRVVYLAFDETDDWAHDGRYDRVLETYVRIDGYLKELWNWIESQQEYRGHTHLLITTDHGRGHTVKDWREHGAEVEGAQDVWIAFVSPRMAQRGEWQGHAPLSSSQIAATLAGWMGVNWQQFRPGAGEPIK